MEGDTGGVVAGGMIVDSRRKQRLAGAGFSGNQNGGIGGGVVNCDAFEPLNGPAATDDIVKTVFGIQSFFDETRADFTLNFLDAVHPLQRNDCARLLPTHYNGLSADHQARLATVHDLVG